MVKNLFLLFNICCAISCQKSNFNLEHRKSLFLNLLEEAQPDEGPFKFSYGLETIYFSEKIISLYGELHQYTNLPHGCGNYEGKTYVKQNGKYKELMINDLFPNYNEIEQLCTYCESDLKTQKTSYFFPPDPLKTHLKHDELNTFVIDENFLIIIFQPYVAGSYADGPFTVKIPHVYIHKHWKTASNYTSNI